jgi:thioredoxin reductase
MQWTVRGLEPARRLHRLAVVQILRVQMLRPMAAALRRPRPERAAARQAVDRPLLGLALPAQEPQTRPEAGLLRPRAAPQKHPDQIGRQSVGKFLRDVLIIGAGPAGLSCGLILARCRRNVVIVDDCQPRNGEAAAVHGYLTQDGSSPAELRRRGRYELTQYGVEFYEDEVVSLARGRKVNGDDSGAPFAAELKSRKTIHSRKVLLATGVVDERPSIPGLAECFGISVHHCPYCDGWESRDQRIAVMGKTPRDCVGLAIALRTWTSDIVVLTDGQVLSPAEKDRLSQSEIGFREAAIVSLAHRRGWLESIELADGSRERCSRCFIDFGTRARSNLLSGFENSVPPDAVDVDDKQRTGTPGLFIAGDVTGEIQMIAIAVAEGATAALAINRELQDEDEQHRRKANCASAAR